VARQIIELQLKVTESNRALGNVLQLIGLNKFEQKRGVGTLQELDAFTESTTSYKTVGRMFIAEPLPSLKAQLRDQLHQVEEQIKSLETKRDYIKKQVKQDEDNLTELVRQIQVERGK